VQVSNLVCFFFLSLFPLFFFSFLFFFFFFFISLFFLLSSFYFLLSTFLSTFFFLLSSSFFFLLSSFFFLLSSFFFLLSSFFFLILSYFPWERGKEIVNIAASTARRNSGSTKKGTKRSLIRLLLSAMFVTCVSNRMTSSFNTIT